jgi:hypothetical protein
VRVQPCFGDDRKVNIFLDKLGKKHFSFGVVSDAAGIDSSKRER